jgi:LysM repeat protein
MVIIVVLGMVSFTYLPVNAAVDSIPNCTRWHTVQRGEYLVKIAELYETKWNVLVQINNITTPNLIIPGQKLCVLNSKFSANPPTFVPTNSSNANVVALNVKEDQYVTLQGKNLATKSRYDIYLGKYKADPIDRYLVGSIITDEKGSFKGTFSIPKKLYDVLKIRVSITNPTSGVSNSNWFINTTGSGSTGGMGSPELSISVQSVNKSDWVKVKTNHLPANVSFNVFMKKHGAPDRKAILVGTLRDTKGGSIEAIFNIPESFKEHSKLEIFAVNNALNMIEYAPFDN